MPAEDKKILKSPNELYDQYIADAKAQKVGEGIITEILGADADLKDKMAVASHLRGMAQKANAEGHPAAQSRQEIGAYLARVNQANKAKKYYQEALKDVENFKSTILRAELEPGHLTSLESGKVSSGALKQMARQQVAMVGIGDGGQAVTGVEGPFHRDFGFNIGLAEANEIAAIAKANKAYEFTTPPKPKNRNAVMDSVAVLRREARLADAEFSRVLSGKELSTAEREAIKKASPVNSSGVQNFLEWSGHNLFKATTKLLPGVFGKDAAEDSRYREYLELRDKMISNHRGYLSSEELRRYLTGLKNKRNEFATAGPASNFDLTDLDSLIAKTEEKVVAANEEDAKKFAETLEKLNTSAIDNIQDLDDKEVAMAKFRMLQIALMASPFGFVNLLGPAFEILGPIFDGNLSFGEGLAQGISNIPFFGDIADALKLTDLFQLFFDEAPLVSDAAGVIKEVINSDIAQELGGAAGPGLSGSPLLILGIAGIFSIFRFDSEVAHAQESHKVEKDSKKALNDAFAAFRKGLSVDKVEGVMKDFMAKQLDIILKSFSKAEMVDFIAKAFEGGGEELKIFDKLKIKYKDPTSGAEGEFTLGELKVRTPKVDLDSPEKVAKLLFAGADAAKVNKFVDAVFAYRGVQRDNDVVDKLAAFAAIPDDEMAAKAKDFRDQFEKEKAVDYLQEKLGFKAQGDNLDEQLNYCKKQAIDHEMMKWKRNKHLVVPTTSPEEPEGVKVGDVARAPLVAPVR